MAFTACGADGPGWTLAPIGDHEVHVGETWSHRLTVLGSPEAPLHWTLRAAPAGLELIDLGAQAQLVWVPDVFRLGPNPPGKPRVPGPPLALEVVATDAAGVTHTARGSVRVVPTLLSAGIDAPLHAVLALDTATTVRIAVRTDTTALAGMPVELEPQASAHAELLELGKGHYVLRYRPSDAEIRASPRHRLRLAAPSWAAPVAWHDIEVELVGRSLAAPCALDPPVLRVAMPAQAPTGQALALAVTAVDGNSPPAAWVARSGSALQDLVSTGHFAVATGAASPFVLPAVASPALLAVQITATDLDDPLLGACAGTAAWPPGGPALIGIGPGCSDDATPAPAALPIDLEAGVALVRRSCPGTADHGRVQQGAHEALGVTAAVPPGWPAVAFEIRSGDALLCSGHSLGRPCWLAPAAAARTLHVTWSATAATSAAIRAVVAPTACTRAPTDPSGGAMPLAPGVTWTATLCPGEVVRLAATGASFGLSEVIIATSGGALEVVEHVAGIPVAAWADRGGGLRTETWLDPSPSHAWSLAPLGDAPVTFSFVFRGIAAPAATLPGDPHALVADTLIRLPFATALALDLSRPWRIVVVAEASHFAGLVLQAGASGGALVPWPFADPPADAAPTLALALLQASIAAPTSGAWSVAPAAGPGVLGARWQPQPGPRARGSVQAHADAVPDCGQDRVDVAAATANAPLALTAPGPRATVLGGLVACAEDTDEFVFTAPADALVEVATLSAASAPPLTITEPDGRLCPSRTLPPGPAAAGLQPGARELATCWLRAAGEVRVRVGPTASKSGYDLVYRAR